MLRFSTHESSGVMVLSPEEADDGNPPTAEREWLYHLIQTREDPRFVIDLGAINYLASSDIGFLVTLKRRIDSRKGRVVFIGVDSYILDTLRVMRLDTLFLFAKDLPEALTKLSETAA